MPDNRSLAEHARRRHEQTLQRAHRALEALAASGGPVTVSRLIREAAVSRSWIYTQPELLDLLEKLRHRGDRTAGPAPNSRASDESLRRRLDLAHQRIAQLRADNHELRDMLARAHGELRAARTQQNP
jgi:Family of unknown function (DUF6262)